MTAVQPFVVVGPTVSADRRAWYGVAADPLVPSTVAPGLRTAARTVCAATWAATILVGMAIGSSPEPVPAVVAWPLSLVWLAGATAPWWVGPTVDRKRQAALVTLTVTVELAAVLEAIRADAVRAVTMAREVSMAGPVVPSMDRSLGVVLWACSQRAVEASAVQGELDAAGPHSTGTAKAAWVADRRRRLASLVAPVVSAEGRVRRLADVAEDTVWAARLAREHAGDRPVPAAPTGPEILAGADLDEALDALSAWHQAWCILDADLRAGA